MARILIAWELGRGLGHLVPMAAVALEARRQGHDVTLALPRGADAQGWLAHTGCPVVEVDLPGAPARSFPLSLNYSANLSRNGYWHAETARGRIGAWSHVMRDVNPDALVAEHAPGALLAGRGTTMTRVVIGNGFAQPPLHDPMPQLQSWLPVPDELLRAADDAWLGPVNVALADLGLPALSAVPNLFDDTTRLLTIERELDHYADRSEGTFIGAMDAPRYLHLSVLPDVPRNGYVFVYVSPFNRYLLPLLSALESLRWPVVAYVPGLPREVSVQHPDVEWLSAPVDLGSLEGRCRLVVTAGGSMLGSRILKLGLPWFICPEDLEKAVLGLQLIRRGLADALNWFAPAPDDFVDRLSRAGGRGLSGGRAAFAERYRNREAETIAREVIDACSR